MKPAWDKLGLEYAGSSSVVIGDADCTVEDELCKDYGVNGYPTIKYFKAGESREGEAYSGGRDYEALKKFTEENLERKCEISEPSSCDEKEQKYIEKMTAKDAAAIVKEIERLDRMKGNKMKAEQKAFLFQRLHILQQMKKGHDEL